MRSLGKSWYEACFCIPFAAIVQPNQSLKAWICMCVCVQVRTHKSWLNAVVDEEVHQRLLKRDQPLLPTSTDTITSSPSIATAHTQPSAPVQPSTNPPPPAAAVVAAQHHSSSSSAATAAAAAAPITASATIRSKLKRKPIPTKTK